MKNEIEQQIFEKMKAKDFGESMCNETKLNVLKWTMQQLRKTLVMCRFYSQIKNQMKIYTIEHGKFAYDSYMGHVVVANSEEEVRQLAKNTSADEGKDVWDNAKVEECGEYTCHRTEPFILMSDFRAG